MVYIKKKSLKHFKKYELAMILSLCVFFFLNTILETLFYFIPSL